jgi:hypothetical protein
MRTPLIPMHCVVRLSIYVRLQQAIIQGRKRLGTRFLIIQEQSSWQKHPPIMGSNSQIKTSLNSRRLSKRIPPHEWQA